MQVSAMRSQSSRSSAASVDWMPARSRRVSKRSGPSTWRKTMLIAKKEQRWEGAVPPASSSARHSSQGRPNSPNFKRLLRPNSNPPVGHGRPPPFTRGGFFFFFNHHKNQRRDFFFFFL